MIDDLDRNFTITADDIDLDTMLGTINATSSSITNMGTFITTQPHTGSPTSLPYYTTPQPTYTFTNQHTSSYDLEVKGDANFEGDIKLKGKSIGKMLEKIEDRLAILQPDPAKLEKYESLRKAYEHYKTLERLIGED